MLRQVTILFAVSWSAYLDSFSFLVIVQWYELGSSLFILCKNLVTSCSLKERVTQTKRNWSIRFNSSVGCNKTGPSQHSWDICSLKRVSCVWSQSKLAFQVLLLLQLYFLRGGNKFLPKKNCFFYMSTGNRVKTMMLTMTCKKPPFVWVNPM